MDKAIKPPLLIIAGGGTGGHVLAGIAVADAWRQSKRGEVLFVGSRGGIEEKLVPRAGYPLELLSLGSLKGVSWGKRFRTIAQLPGAFLQSIGILLKHRPIAVLGVGGYSSGPLVLMARWLWFLVGSRVAVLEQNAVPGFTNRVLGRFAHVVLTAFPGIEAGFPNKVLGQTLVVTGNPVRKEFHAFDREGHSPDRFRIFIFGGSQGALGINSLMLGALPGLEAYRDRIEILHQTGERDYERVQSGYAGKGFNVRVEKFVYDMATAYREADVVIGRSGSSTLSELAVVGRASLLIPFPFASDNHQEKNALLFQRAGAAKVARQSEYTGDGLAKQLSQWIQNPATLREMENNALKLAKNDAAALIIASLSVVDPSSSL